MNTAQKTIRLAQLCSRQIIQRSASTKGCAAPNVKAAQLKFQMDNGLPVHLKGGILDTVLLQVTAGLCLIGLGMSFHVYYKLAVPPQQ